jgi:ABC-type glycerol-3-phosphate transport system substrate-binding protein
MDESRAGGVSRRTVIGLGGAAAPAILLAACGGPGAGGAPAARAKPVKIAYWGKWGGSSQEPEEAVIAAFQQQFPPITVEGLEADQIGGSGAVDREKFTAALAAGTPPDVIKIDRFKMGGHGAKRTTTVLDDLNKRDKIDMKKFYQATVDEVLYPPGPGGNVTALPWNTDDRALIYHKQHFQEAGLDPSKPPRTWEELLDYGVRLTKREGNDVTRAGLVAEGSGTNWSIGWHWAAGGTWLKPGSDGKPNRKAAFNDDKARKWADFLKETQNRVFGSYENYQAWSQRWGPREKGAWYNDGMSMGVNGVWNIGDFKKYGPGVDWGVAPPPRPKGLEGTPVTWAGGFALAIPTGIKGDNLAAAWEFLKYYCYGKESQVLFGSKTGQMPALLEAAEDKAFRESDPHMPVFVDIMRNAKIRDVTPAGDEVWFDNANKERQFALFELRNRVLEGKLPVNEIFNQSEQYINQTLDQAWAQAGG